MPCIAIARCFSKERCVAMIHSQVQCHDTITAISSSSGVGVVSANSVCLTIPSVAIASSDCFLCIYGFVDS